MVKIEVIILFLAFLSFFVNFSFSYLLYFCISPSNITLCHYYEFQCEEKNVYENGKVKIEFYKDYEKVKEVFLDYNEKDLYEEVFIGNKKVTVEKTIIKEVCINTNFSYMKIYKNEKLFNELNFEEEKTYENKTTEIKIEKEKNNILPFIIFIFIFILLIFLILIYKRRKF
jgi:hypothetical protein